ncbi:MAG: hypothetical protein JJE39_00170 [Vicinamibacteria bacterium]|nr:hypothetical protein [Vicinamibacteria bacterium]
MKNTLHVVGLVVALSTAQIAGAVDEPAKAPRESELTLGVIQRSIKAGMSSSEVLDASGSPNLVTRGRNGKESWVYDRFATETSEQGFQVGGGGLGAGSTILGVLGAGGSRKKTSTSQRTLMLVVTFGSDGLVESFAYRSSRF